MYFPKNAPVIQKYSYLEHKLLSLCFRQICSAALRYHKQRLSQVLKICLIENSDTVVKEQGKPVS